MRDIKFRVRDKSTKEVLGYEHFNTSLNSGYYYIDLREPIDDGCGGKDYICKTEYNEQPMLKSINPLSGLLREQYTGLKDKNGVEIYEGDICLVEGLGNCEVGICSFYGAVFKKDNCEYPVVDSIAENDLFEVIGNIYENPELLESK